MFWSGPYLSLDLGIILSRKPVAGEEADFLVIDLALFIIIS